MGTHYMQWRGQKAEKIRTPKGDYWIKQSLFQLRPL